MPDAKSVNLVLNSTGDKLTTIAAFSVVLFNHKKSKICCLAEMGYLGCNINIDKAATTT